MRILNVLLIIDFKIILIIRGVINTHPQSTLYQTVLSKNENMQMLSFLIRKHWYINTRQNNIWTHRHKKIEILWFSGSWFFECACSVSYLGYWLEILPDASSRSLLHVCKQQRLWRDCAYAQSRQRLCWSPMWWVPFSNVLVGGWWDRTWGRFLCI